MNQNDGCVECATGTYSLVDATSSCTNCPEGKTSESGSASQDRACTWGESTFYVKLELCGT